jgi:general secretion pathway protein G
MKRLISVLLLVGVSLSATVARAKDEPALFSKEEPIEVRPDTNGYSVGTFGLKMVVDVDIRTTVSQSAGEADKPAGIAFWAADPDNFYAAAVRADGQYFVFRRQSGEWSTIATAQTGSAVVKPGLNTENELRVVTQGTTATVHANGRELVSITGSPPKEGSLFGIFAESGGRPYTWRFSSYRVLMAKQENPLNDVPELETATAIWPGDTPEEREVNETLSLYEMAVRVFYDEMKRMPRTMSELAYAPADAKPEQWHGIYQFRNGLPRDPWGRSYRMRSPGRYADDFVDLWSSGPDGRDGTSDDIGNWNGSTDGERIANAALSRLSSAALNFHFDMKRPPRELDELFTAPTEAQGNGEWRGPYLLGNGLPNDPWGRPYRSRVPGVRDPDGVDFWSAGPDGVDGTSDDIGSWKNSSER